MYGSLCGHKVLTDLHIICDHISEFIGVLTGVEKYILVCAEETTLRTFVILCCSSFNPLAQNKHSFQLLFVFRQEMDHFMVRSLNHRSILRHISLLNVAKTFVQCPVTTGSNIHVLMKFLTEITSIEVPKNQDGLIHLMSSRLL